MKATLHLLFFAIPACFFFHSCQHSQPKTPTESVNQPEGKYIFFLHNQFLEEFELTDEHPEYGRAEYKEIIEAFEKEGFTVISEKRPKNTDIRLYASEVVVQIDSMLISGIKPDQITVIGTSKGGYIAQYVSTMLNNPKVNFVFIGSYQNTDIEEYPDINFSGNILNIYEETDPLGVSAIERKNTSTQQINRFQEIELHTNLKHGFLYKAMDEWIVPSISWANREY